MSLAPLVLRGRTGDLTVSPPILLAPLHGVTDAAFLAGVLPLGGIGAACMPFVRISGSAFGLPALRRHWSFAGSTCPVGLQLLAQNRGGLTETAVHAVSLGVPFLDLNFGCPSPTVLRSGGGAALLDHPDRIADLVACVVAAVDLPVTVKLRAGGEDDARLEEVLDAAAGAGAAAITLHARLRREDFAVPADPVRIRRAVAHLTRRHPTVPLIGNGGVRTPQDARDLFAITGCAAVMLGTGIMADPWLAGRLAGRPGPGPDAVPTFLRRYAQRLCAIQGPAFALGRLKQLLGTCAVPEWPVSDERRRGWLRQGSLASVLDDLASVDDRPG